MPVFPVQSGIATRIDEGGSRKAGRKFLFTGQSTPLEFDTDSSTFHESVLIDSTHVLQFWAGPGVDGFAQIFAIDASTSAVTALGSALEFDANDAYWIGACLIDGNHVFCMWMGVSDDGFCQIFEINLGTWAVTGLGSPLEFDTADGAFNECVLVDSTHVLMLWAGPGVDGYTQVVSVNVSTGAIAAIGSALEYDTTMSQYINITQLTSTHYLAVYRNSLTTGVAQVLAVDLGTYAVTKVGTPLGFTGADNISVKKIDATHVIVVRNLFSPAAPANAQVFAISGAWVVTAIGSEISFGGLPTGGGDYGQYSRLQQMEDAFRYVCFFRGTGDTGFMQALVVDFDSYVVSLLGPSSAVGAGEYTSPSTARISATKFFTAWTGVDGDGFAQVFQVS